MKRLFAAICAVWVGLAAPSFAQSRDALAEVNRCIKESEVDPDRALVYCARAMATRDKLPADEVIRVLLIRGNIYVNKNDLDSAFADFNEAVRIRPQDARGYGSRGMVWHKKRELDHAITDYDESFRLDPTNDDLLVLRGIAFKEKNDLNRALADFDTALRIDPKNPNAQQQRCLVLKKMGSSDPCPAR